MDGSDSPTVARTRDEPAPDAVLDEMQVCEPYTVSDLQDLFPDASRWTLQRRLDTLVDEGAIEKKKHTTNRVSYWIPDHSE